MTVTDIFLEKGFTEAWIYIFELPEDLRQEAILELAGCNISSQDRSFLLQL